jgi:Zn-dependent peptidase ImmA (M78 family)
MKLLLKNLEKYGLGDRPLTEDDFFNICSIEGIEIIWSDGKHAFYFSLQGKHFIVLPKRRRGLKMLFAMYHELGHYAAHIGDEPDVAFLDLTHTKQELEADAVALVALIPKHMLKELAFLDGSRYGSHLYNERVRLYFLYGI